MGGGAASPEPERVAAAPEHRHRRHKPARPERERPAQEPKAPASQTPPSEKPRLDTKPERRPARPADLKPTARPDPAAVTKPETRPATKPKPEPKPRPRPKPAGEEGLQGFTFGRPPSLKPGLPDAWWVYQDDAGWHVRTTTDDRHQMKGRVWVTTGKLASVKVTVLEKQDGVQSDAQSIDIDFDTDKVMDGVDFVLTGTKCAHFALLVDGKPEPKLIHLGASTMTPPSATFVLCGR
jgi:hypothetical protein